MADGIDSCEAAMRRQGEGKEIRRRVGASKGKEAGEEGRGE